MRIAHVVTLVSPDGAYGGPLTVALGLARAMQGSGHSVEIFAGYRGEGPPPHELDGVRAHLYPVRRVVPRTAFAGLIAPGLRRDLQRGGFDIVHVHLARDLITLPAAAALRSRRMPYAVQTHGMIDRPRRRLARILDALLTRRVLRSARAVFHLNANERDALAEVGRSPELRLSRLPNGQAAHNVRASPDGAREVLFLARLAPRKRPTAFVEAAKLVIDRGVRAQFTLVGPDEGEGARVRARVRELGAEDYVRWVGPVAPAAVLERMSQAGVYVLPAVDEPWGMSALEAMSVGLPVVVTDSCGVVDEVSDSGSLVVVGREPREIADAIVRLLEDPQLRSDIGQRAQEEVQRTFEIGAVAETALAAYAREFVN